MPHVRALHLETLTTEQFRAMHRRRTCLAKRRHKFLKRAAAEASRLRSWDKIRPHYEWYPCEYCGFYHVGHKRFDLVEAAEVAE